jgi:hypothetical protein
MSIQGREEEKCEFFLPAAEPLEVVQVVSWVKRAILQEAGANIE